jgi:hypothetical protein
LQLWYDENLEDFEDLVDETVELELETNSKEEYSLPIEIIETWVVVLEQRKYFMALLNHYYESEEGLDFEDVL